MELKDYIESVTSLLRQQLGEVDSNEGPLSTERIRVEIIRSTIIETTAYMQVHPFASLEEEILYNKRLGPFLHSEFLIHLKRLEFEKKKLTGSVKKIQDFIYGELEIISNFLEKHEDFFYRYLTNINSDDAEWFTSRGWERVYSADPILIFAVDKSPGLALLTQILAYKELRGYWMECLADPSSIEQEGVDPEDGMQLKWTDSKVDWIELIEALHLKGSFNHGKASLSMIARILSKPMHVFYKSSQELYAATQDIGIRKKKVAKFLGALVDLLRGKYGRGFDEHTKD